MVLVSNRTQADIDRIVQSFCDELDASAAEIRQSCAAAKSADFTPAAAQLKTFNEAIWKITASLVLTDPSGWNQDTFSYVKSFRQGFFARLEFAGSTIFFGHTFFPSETMRQRMCSC